VIKKTSKGKKTAAILPIKKYEELMEDLHDLAVVAERRVHKKGTGYFLNQKSSLSPF